MAEIKKVEKLDQKLIEMDIIDPTIEKDYQLVHTMLNKHVRKTGKILTDETFKKGDEALRKWLMLLYKKGAAQDKLTSYLRCGLAHLSFDYIESNFSQIGLDDLISRALKSFKQRGFHKTFFRVSSNEMNELASRKRSQKKKSLKKAKSATKKSSGSTTKKASKKASKKSTSKKKSPTKPAPKRKVAAKKSSAKKKTIKKPAAKKKVTAKKYSAKKKTVKKVAAKKPSSKRKAAVKKSKKSKSTKSNTVKKLGKKVNVLFSKIVKQGK